MFKELSSQIYLLFLFITVAFAWWKGGRAERIGSLFNAIISIGVIVFQTATRGAFDTIPMLVADGLLATGFLFLAFRFATLWLASAMVLQSATFLIHAALLMGLLPKGAPPTPDFYYYLTMNLLGAGVMLSILIGTAFAWRRRLDPAAAVA